MPPDPKAPPVSSLFNTPWQHLCRSAPRAGPPRRNRWAKRHVTQTVCSQTQLVSGRREGKEQRMGFNPFAVAVTTHPRLGICKRARYFWISVSSGSVGQGKDEVR